MKMLLSGSFSGLHRFLKENRIFFQKMESFFIKHFDSRWGYYRYFLGKKYLGKLEQYKCTRNIYYLMAPSFGNVGDEAIVEATLLFLRDMFPEYTVIIIDYLDTLQMLKEIERILKKDDLVILQGGGNIGTLYYGAEKMREIIVDKLKNTTIISMPQSVYFANTISGRKKLNRCKKVYNTHTNFILIAREKYSYKYMRKEFPNCRILLNPDIVFYLSKVICKNNMIRSGIMICLRTDKEESLGNMRYEVIRTLVDKYANVIISDTCVPRNVSSEIRHYEVESLINQFRRSKLVITDRLHGMILAVLTDTPCIVMPSMDSKVYGTYEWIRNIDLVRFIDTESLGDILNIVEEMLNSSYSSYYWDGFRKKYFSDLRERIGV